MNTEPEGALVLLDGEPVGITPIRLPSSRLKEAIELELEGHHKGAVRPDEALSGDAVIVRLRARD